MEIRFKIAGIEAVVNVQDAAEASRYFASLAGITGSGSTPVATDAITDNTSLMDPVASDTASPGQPKFDDAAIRRALQRIQGRPASKLLVALMGFLPNGCSDTKLKEILGVDEDSNVGPQVANISKQCGRQGIKVEAVILKKIKRGAEGKLHYRYRITDQAARIIKTIDKFTEPANFTGFEDEEDE